MANSASLVLPLLFLVMFASVENAVRANTCSEALGTCGNGGCDARCKARWGPVSQGTCDKSVIEGLCTCHYDCGTPAPRADASESMCEAILIPCGPTCGNNCCNQKCSTTYALGRGACKTLNAHYLCQCEYPC